MNNGCFYEVDERGCVYQLSNLACGHAPFGETVYAASHAEAAELYFRYKNGERDLKRDLWIDGEHNPYKNVIHENAHFILREVTL